jgi:hypothetical protein
MQKQRSHHQHPALRHGNHSFTMLLAKRFGLARIDSTFHMGMRHYSQCTTLRGTVIDMESNHDEPLEHADRRLHIQLPFFLGPSRTFRTIDATNQFLVGDLWNSVHCTATASRGNNERILASPRNAAAKCAHHASSNNLREPAPLAIPPTNAPNLRFKTASMTPGITK